MYVSLDGADIVWIQVLLQKIVVIDSLYRLEDEQKGEA